MTSPSFSTNSSSDGADRALAICGWSALGLLVAAVLAFGVSRHLGLPAGGQHAGGTAAVSPAELALQQRLDRIAGELGLSRSADTLSTELQQDPARLEALRGELAEIAAQHPGSRRAYYYQALERLAARDYPGARNAANRSLELEGRDLSATLVLGAAHFAEGSYAEAAKAFRWAIQIEPRSLPAYDNLGQTLWMMGLKDQALEVYRRRAQVEGVAFVQPALPAPQAPSPEAPAEAN